MKKVFVALGSNLGVPEAQLENAILALKKLPFSQSFDLSHWYKSAPIGGPADQPDYLNAVCTFQTALEPLQLLKALQRIEQLSGRVREVRWGPRTLDLDIIWYENFTSDSSVLTVPHPRAHQRAFVLKPLSDLSPTMTLQGKSLPHWLEETQHQSIQKV
jgi:2-amino-4-hydroxy-6-hydroxymethyldihydropteridine diphosphokinase